LTRADRDRKGGLFRFIRLIFSTAFVLSIPARTAVTPPSQARPDLKSLLASAADYGDKLCRAVLDFVCRERIEEWFHPEARAINSSPTVLVQTEGGQMTFSSGSGRFGRVFFVGRREKHFYEYDYQLIRGRTGAIQERRTLLKEDKKEVNVPEATLRTRLFWHAHVVMGPLGLLSRERQEQHDYRVKRETKERGERVLVIEAVPKPGVAADHLIGQIWLRIEDAAILRIEWDPASIQNYAGVEECAARLNATPRVVLASEYGFEKNGIRFPSRYTVQEIYARGNRRFQRSETDVIYDQYKFFTVETEVKTEKS
jgi:hypothetical protein